ncbi:MAG: hypothetical protein JO026_03765 [Patescibacteria group bacterium]|nr:hypothetical protein [Patescibacteria group bacterium]
MGRRLLFPLVLLSLPLFAAASDSFGLSIDMAPAYPHPGDAIVLTATSYSGSADTAYVWNVDGKTVLSGIGEKTLHMPAGALGSEDIVDVSAQENGTSLGSARAIVRPADIDLVWEGKTSVPPLYPGLPLPNSASTVSVLAVPHLYRGGRELPSQTLLYSWSVNGVPLASESGYGNASALVTPPNFAQPFTVSVHVEDTSGTIAGESETTISPQVPRVNIYEYAPLVGIRFEKNIAGMFTLSGSEVSFAAFPFFVNDPAQLSYQWSLDGSAFDVDPARPLDVTFRKTGNATGPHQVQFSLANRKNFVENVAATFILSL